MASKYKTPSMRAVKYLDLILKDDPKTELRDMPAALGCMANYIFLQLRIINKSEVIDDMFADWITTLQKGFELSKLAE